MWVDGTGDVDDARGWEMGWPVEGSGAHGIGLSPAEAIDRRRCMWPYSRHVEGDRYLIGIVYVGVYVLWVGYVAFRYYGDDYCGGLNVSERSAGTDGTDASDKGMYMRQPYTIVIRRRRHARRRRGGRPASGRRARCRRFEACFVIWLLCSNHLAAAKCGERRGGIGWTYMEHGGATEGCYRTWAGSTYDCAGAEMTTTSDVARIALDAGTRTTRNGSTPGSSNLWWTKCARVGEAANPGPTSATLVAEGLLRKVYSSARAALEYPRPGENSLSRTVTPGYGANRDPGADGGAMTLTIETVNATGWRALQRRLLTSSSHVVLAQETWLTQDALPAASAWALRNGWQSIWAAAVPGPQGGASGGAAVFVRTGLGLRYPPGMTHVWWPGRVVAAMVDAPGHRPLLVISCYLIHGIGPSEGNLQILADMGQRLKAIGGGTMRW